ncbi:MAG: hypothetical protein HeimC2_43740 [Candidatus Heimdallarchaeota archaeon LC_2]|nr:MAG: hypothetical protein HeimC2_43740 [Candidatus Heimdallarchaeota archaeon LC_2]
MASQVIDKSVLLSYLKDGKVNYSLLKNDLWLKKNLEKMKNTNVKELTYSEEFAFWLNAYNLLTLQAVCKELEKNPNWKGNLSYFSRIRFFALRRHSIGSKKISLYTLENKILRKKFKDPRIHFAINCASISCPFLPGKLFEADSLETYLEDLTYQFINDQNSVILNEDTLSLNQIFKWYKKDFKEGGGLITFINKYWKGSKIPNNIRIEYLKYDWHINSIS